MRSYQESGRAPARSLIFLGKSLRRIVIRRWDSGEQRPALARWLVFETLPDCQTCVCEGSSTTIRLAWMVTTPQQSACVRVHKVETTFWGWDFVGQVSTSCKPSHLPCLAA